jgi:hypothetical protein
MDRRALIAGNDPFVPAPVLMSIPPEFRGSGGMLGMV